MHHSFLRHAAAFVAMVAVSVILAACDSGESTTAPESAMVSPGAIALCTGCGQIKGSESCCAPGQAACAGCGLAKGSPGCCRIEKGSDEPVALCAKCGQIKGDASCCKPGAPDCAGCGLDKGSPGCCKIK